VPILLAEEILKGKFLPETIEAVPVDGHKAMRLRGPGRSVFVERSEAMKLAQYLRRDRPDLADKIIEVIPDI
jgi:hypothetical protein